MVKIKDIPVLERPREKILNHGASTLTNEELLAVILKTGTHNMSVKELSNYVLKEINDFTELKNITLESLKKIKGIGDAKACELLASIELGKRLNLKFDNIKEIKITSAENIYEYYKELLMDKNQEYFYCVYLDNKNKIIKDKQLYIGTINQTLVHPRDIFKEAYLLNASSIICVHNHPTGDVSPSNNDKEFTKELYKVGITLGIKVLDHIIIGNQNYYSFTEHGLI